MEFTLAYPSISVVIPAYRVTGYISEAIDSILAQTFPDLEIIVVNDGCPDTLNLDLVLAPYLAENQIRYISQENRGVSGARNTGIRAARADLIAVLDADDVLCPNTFDMWLDMMRQHPNAGMVYGNAICFGGSRVDGQEMMKYYPSRSNSVSYADLITRKAHVFGCAMYKRDVLFDVGLYDENLPKAEDFDLALGVARSGAGIENTTRVAYKYRIRPGSLSTQSTDIQVWRIRVLEKHQKRPDLSPAENEMIAAELRYQHAMIALEESKVALLNGDYRRARGRLRQANREFGSVRLAITSLALLLLPVLLRQFALFRERRLQARNGSLMDKASGL